MRQCKRKRIAKRKVMMGKVAGLPPLHPPLSVTASIATSCLLRLLSPQRYIDHHHASPHPHGGGRVIKKALISLTQAEKNLSTLLLLLLLIPMCRAVVLLVQCRSFTSAAGATLASVCSWRRKRVCVWRRGMLYH